MRTLALFAVLAAMAAVTAAVRPALAAAQDAPRTELVSYENPEDGMVLSAYLTLPPGPGPFPGVVVASLAGLDPLVERLVGRGWAVLLPERRGMRTVEHMLEATYQDLANDVLAAQAYLRARPEVDADRVGLLGQGDDAPATLLAATGTPQPAFVVLISVEGIPGAETFRSEQRVLAELQRYDAEALEALDRHLAEVTEIVLGEESPATRAFRLEALIRREEDGLPRQAALPETVEGKVEFLASPLWRDRLSQQPERLLASLRAPVLVLMGTEDPFTDFRRHLPLLRGALDAAPSDDVLVCLLSGRVRHSFTPEALQLIEEWLPPRTAAARGVPAACLDENAIPG